MVAAKDILRLSSKDVERG